MRMRVEALLPVIVCCVGHGPSLRGRGLGKSIDQCVVARISPRAESTGPAFVDLCGKEEDYGTRTDYMFLEAYGCFYRMDSRRTWIRQGEIRSVLSTWISKVRHTPPRLSRGFQTIVAVCHILRPETILLAGYDSLWGGARRGEPYERMDGSCIASQDQCDYEREKSLLAEVERPVRRASLELT
jgi:hypothetical protein